MECIYTHGTSSASHTYGNVAAFLKVMLLDYFPQDFFTGAYIDSTVAWRDISNNLGVDGREFKKRHYPFMIINPRFINSDRDPMFNIPLLANYDNAEAGLNRNTLFDVIRDVEHQNRLAFKLNRDKLEFDVELRLRSQVQQIDVLKNLQNQMIWDRTFARRAALEAMIPKSMIAYMGKVAGIDIMPKMTDDENTPSNIPLIMSFLQAHSKFPITYMVRNSTSVEEFFMFYKTDLHMTFTDLQGADSLKKNSVIEYTPISFHVTVEFNLPGLFALIGSHEKKYHGFRFDTIVDTPSTSASELIPLYTYTNLYDKFHTDTNDGFQLQSTVIIHPDETGPGKVERVKLSAMIQEQYMDVLNTFLNDNISPDTLFRFRLLADAHEMPFHQDIDVCRHCWTIDWDRRELVISCPDPTVTYRAIVYGNMIMLNQRFGDMQNKTKPDIQEPLPNQ